MSKRRCNDDMYIMIKRICLSLIGLSFVAGITALTVNSNCFNLLLNKKSSISLSENTILLILAISLQIIVFVVNVIKMDSNERSEGLGKYTMLVIALILFTCLVFS